MFQKTLMSTMMTVVQNFKPLDVIQAGNRQKPITELDRLSLLVRTIDHECAIVPRDAFRSTVSGELIRNIDFRGIQKDEDVNLDAFRHYRDVDSDLKLKLQGIIFLLKLS